MMAMLRSTLHMAVMFVTVIPYTLLILLARLFGAKGNAVSYTHLTLPTNREV